MINTYTMCLFGVVNYNNINIHQYYLVSGFDSSSPKSLRKKYIKEQPAKHKQKIQTFACYIASSFTKSPTIPPHNLFFGTNKG